MNSSFAHRRSRCAATAQWNPRAQNPTAAMAQSAIGSACTAREFVSTASVPRSAGVRLPPAPPDAVWAQRSVAAAAAATAAGTPHPK